jgi:hypothetical protein
MKHIKPIFESSFPPLDYNKYEVIWGEDIIPDTDFGVYTDSKGNQVIVPKSEVSNLPEYEYTFDGVAVTQEYGIKASKAKDEYLDLKSYNDGVRSDDDQYYDPTEDRLYDEYKKYYKKGNWSSIFWDYQV